MLRDGLLNAYWVQVNNNLQAAANANEEGYPGYRNPENFIVVSDAYPTVTAQAADLVLPTAMWVEKEGAYGNAERRTQFWHQLVNAPGEARSDLWQLMEFSKRFKIEEVWPAELIAKKPDVRGKTLFDVLFKNGEVDKFPLSEMAAGYENHESKAFGFYVQKGLFEEYAEFGRGHGHDLAPFDAYHEARGLRWPVVKGKETRWRFREGHDPYVKEGKGVEFYGFADGKARIFALPYEPPAESPDNAYPVLAGHRPRAGALALRLDDAARAGTAPRVPGSGLLHASGRRGGAQHAPRRRGEGAIAARLHPHAARNARTQSHAARRGVRAVVRRKPAHQQGDARRHRSDLVADRLQEMRGPDRARVRSRIMRHHLGLLAAAVLVAAALDRSPWRRPSRPCAARRRSIRRGRRRR